MNGIASLRGYQEGGPPDPYGFSPFRINENRMENLLDSLSALVGGDLEIYRSIISPSLLDPTGRREEDIPMGVAFDPAFNTPLRGYQVNRSRINLIPAGDWESRLGGAGFRQGESGEPMTEEWSPAERSTVSHEIGHILDARNILPESLEKMQRKSNAPMYPWQYMGKEGEDIGWLKKALAVLERRLMGTYTDEKLATQYGKAIGILQDSKDPERRSEAVRRINSREMRLLVEELLKHPVYENHPLHNVIIGLENPPVMQQDATGIRGIK